MKKLKWWMILCGIPLSLMYFIWLIIKIYITGLILLYIGIIAFIAKTFKAEIPDHIKNLDNWIINNA